LKSNHQLSKCDGIIFSSKQKVFTLQNHPAGQIQPRNGLVLAPGPYVWHSCSRRRESLRLAFPISLHLVLALNVGKVFAPPSLFPYI